MSANFSVDTSQFDTLQRNVERLPNEAEKVINETLKVNVSPVLEKSILGLMPISNRNKKHAKLYKSLNLDNKENLTITIKPKAKYRYLVFPDLGLGTSKKKAAQKFMEHGVEQKVNYSINELNKSLIEQINKTLGAR
ncbi:hypothetical protein P4V88_05855 [Bacillus thuringiensis]|uniref:hypothetical protein n=1 Tax=Bacillus thuringiensis TaxID=1428 RepID=UPI000A36ACC3|nr:hypothetical protein [Bacillus thuringiensis]MED2125450.1 hypothetical protein [Bacillus thuringiensis]MED2146802.1 hypothetical protein [Bacillus thuringiensis]MED2171502.1 hypothetical protein [Bacillus thuringiensis]MED2476193.1 hypothetical protein [Bacillus thuringiensis]MED2650735.1 hypothetical protein [Bacillus thuringiensis]